MRPTFEQVYRNYLAHVGRAVGRRVPELDADDVVQHVWKEIAGALPRYDPAYALVPWINTIIARAISAHFKRETTRITAEQGLAAEPQRPAPLCEDELETAELIDAGLACLKPGQREVVDRVIRREEPLEVVAKDLGITVDGVYKKLQAALKKLEDFGRRQEALERRVLGKRGALFLPLGLSLHVEAWIARVRAALGRALMKLKAASMTFVASAGVAIALGGGVVPNMHASAPATDVAAKIAVAVPVMSVNPTTTIAPAPARSSAEQPTALPAKSAVRSALKDPERRSLDSIEPLLEADPAAALAALDRHRKAFPDEKLAAVRLIFEALAEAAAEQQRQASLGASPP